MKLLRIVAAVAISVCAMAALGQSLPSRQETRSYSYGVGRIAWTFPGGLPAVFAVPRWTAGARVECEDKVVRCEVQVHARDISIPDEDFRAELAQAMRLRLPSSTKRVPDIQTYGANRRIVYITFNDSRRGQRPRFLTLGYAYQGPALLRFEVTADNAAQTGSVLALVDQAKAIDALAMWSLRMREFRAVCAERFPAYKDANERAFAASPFAAVEPVRETVNAEPLTVAEIARHRMMQFTVAFDGNTPERKRSFCESFPKWLAEAAKGL